MQNWQRVNAMSAQQITRQMDRSVDRPAPAAAPIVDIHAIYALLARPFRGKRLKLFAEWFNIAESTRVIDVGGTPWYWREFTTIPNVCIINLMDDRRWQTDDPRGADKIKVLIGDGTCLNYADNSFDIAFASSVIEHVGNWQSKQAFAQELRRVADRYYVQTPNKWFFIEPHFITPFIHFLPRQLFRKLVRNFSVWGLVNKPTQAQVDAEIDTITLLDLKQMRMLFPDAEIHRERFLGMTKSIIAIKR
jgi:hypothetical protein